MFKLDLQCAIAIKSDYLTMALVQPGDKMRLLRTLAWLLAGAHTAQAQCPYMSGIRRMKGKHPNPPPNHRCVTEEQVLTFDKQK